MAVVLHKTIKSLNIFLYFYDYINKLKAMEKHHAFGLNLRHQQYIHIFKLNIFISMHLLQTTIVCITMSFCIIEDNYNFHLQLKYFEIFCVYSSALELKHI